VAGLFRRSATILLLLGLVACGQRSLRPETVPVGRVACSVCGMLVSREDQSAEWIAAGEEPRFYDDIGCLATDPWSPPGRSARFVHVGRFWSPAESVFYAHPPTLSTPMGYDVAAFATREAAAASDRAGRARTWQELSRELRLPRPAGGPVPGPPAVSH
jgi:copper chaperone NosL